MEAYIERLWAEILETSHPLCRSDNFFALGGYSMLAMLILVRIRRELEIELPIRSLSMPVIGDFAGLVAETLGIEPVLAGSNAQEVVGGEMEP